MSRSYRWMIIGKGKKQHVVVWDSDLSDPYIIDYAICGIGGPLSLSLYDKEPKCKVCLSKMEGTKKNEGQ